MMTFSFLCPFPCDHGFTVVADDADEAAEGLVSSGALRCRNSDYGSRCEHALHKMVPIPRERLKQIVKQCMQQDNAIPCPAYPPRPPGSAGVSSGAFAEYVGAA